jgi:tRNA dimethylallyltransferase
MILALTGPTGTGKSELAIALASALSGEIVNADAFQVYEGLTIATAAPSEKMKQEARHHLYAYVPLNEGYDIHRYQKDCRGAIADILSRGKTPILVGGSGLYLRSALYDYDLTLDVSSVDMTSYEGLSDEDLHAELRKLDPPEAAKIPYQNRRRVYRALQICLAAKMSKTAFLAAQKHEPIAPTRFFALTKERSELYPLLDERVERMFASGLLEETLPLIQKYGMEAPAFRAIGVKELFPYLEGTLSLEETKRLIQEDTRHYAKRQETFFRHQFPLEYVSGLADLLEKVTL